MTYSIHYLSEKPESRPLIDALSDQAWPEFLLHGDVRHWHLLFEIFTDHQILLFNNSGVLMAVGHTVPIIWDGTIADLPPSIEQILLRGEKVYKNKQQANTLCAVAAMVAADFQGQGLSSSLISEMKSLAQQHGYTSLIAPVRPVWKSRYPLTPMEHYVTWKRKDGAPLDPWIRVHWQLGAEALYVAPNTLTVIAAIEKWEAWTGMIFPESGSYVIPGALQPVLMDCEKNVGSYEDPNYWMKHHVD